MEQERIIDKIKKCLALSQSDNPNEAASALRQAQALMRKHGIDEATLSEADIIIVMADELSASAVRPAQWEMGLMHCIGLAFGCSAMILPAPKIGGRRTGNAAYRYVGLTSQAELAAYTGTVLLRRVRSARDTHVAGLKKEARIEGWRLTAAEAKSAGEAYATGWVSQVAELVEAFAQPAGVKQAIARRMQEITHGKVARSRRASLSEVDISSMKTGVDDAKSVRLHQPVSKASNDQLRLTNA